MSTICVLLLLRKLTHLPQSLFFSAEQNLLCIFVQCSLFFFRDLCYNRIKIDYQPKEVHMDTRVALIGIIVEDPGAVDALNGILHEYSAYIIGRMGIPYRQKHINVISIAVDAPQDCISPLSGKIGRLHGVSTKTAYSNVIFSGEQKTQNT